MRKLMENIQAVRNFPQIKQPRIAEKRVLGTHGCPQDRSTCQRCKRMAKRQLPRAELRRVGNTESVHGNPHRSASAQKCYALPPRKTGKPIAEQRNQYPQRNWIKAREGVVFH